eukprot:CAMPEP_0172517358 /NCGR_PEP_ID=MMETSP1066-20121228/284527_1 /TAXON_ID=671091 /ORGANISM="Coscinodiscus wailesii, Strain CCMP2513" /LENGTH=188 /DNA_ID=CAMNT_0013299327 /DNA_START=131 /DNA_END=697 /DNA_ORIENTATION=+
MNEFIGMKLETSQNEVGVIQSSFGTSGKFKVHFPAGTCVKDGDAIYLRFKRFMNDPNKVMHQDLVLPDRVEGTRVEGMGKKEKGKKKNKNDAATAAAAGAPTRDVKAGEIASFKKDLLENGKPSTAIITGFFTPEENIREKVGMTVVVIQTKEEGKIAGPFGKAGKCKVVFDSGVTAPVGAKVHLILS